MVVLSERAAVRRLHDRLGFGPRPGDLDRGFAETRDRLLGAGPDAGAEATPMPDPGPPPGKPGKNADPAAKQQARKQTQAQATQAVSWWLDRMAAADLASVERLTWFWHGHFATSEQKVCSPRLMLAQNRAQRDHALGSFTDLARAMVVDPAMLLWLDGNSNKAGKPNENLSREFMELFTLGVGHYTEDDVREAARALTGWTAKRDATGAQLVAKRHDDGVKHILGTDGDYTTQSFVDLVLSRPESAPFVAGRVWFRLVSATPPPADVLNRLVAAYGSRRDIRALLRAITDEAAFHDSATSLVKQPVEWLAGLLRALGVRPAKLEDKTRTQLLAALRGMGQVPFQPPSVGGWAAGGAWLTTSAGVARLHAAQLVAEHADLGAVAKARDKAAAIGDLLGVDAWSDRTRTALAGVGGNVRQLSTVAACAPEYVVSG
ncbi:Uncharacterized conserved protein, DUF1800 family [Amycolatopsis pretoriensis]|uniref:Uncharacterized conserved protein, DUF1800 family n=1 Tax=Amycolatopsis pretoriensis TaxID=218821 RepID=A0A1H5RH10_9PSEU|nr:DUF1800 domain-containing protein [Amycolatopsis pretoriensis]SEF37579.1 Uncharacterized conserved protein, DUF1800 family [Amycolatopsis pretoriensis]